jgi:hypothetical protein
VPLNNMCSNWWAIPFTPGASLREPILYQTWTVTTGALWTSLLKIVNPFANTVFLTLAVNVAGGLAEVGVAGTVGVLVGLAGGCLAISVLTGDSAATATADWASDAIVGVARIALKHTIENNIPNRYRRHITQKFLSLNISH